MHYLDSNKTLREKARCELHKNATCCFELIPEAASHKTAAAQLLISQLPNHLLMDTSVCGWPAKTYIHQFCEDAGGRTYQEQWMIGTDGERERESAQVDDDNDDEAAVL